MLSEVTATNPPCEKVLTGRQREVLAFLKKFTQEKGYPPTRKDIADHFGWSSTNAAQDHLRAMAKKGFVFIGNRQARGISVA